MARTVQQCNDAIVSALVTEFASVGVTINPALWSKASLLRVICWSIAVAQSLFEQLQDISIAKMEAIQATSPAASAAWLQDAAFKFQYSATTPQYLTVISGVCQYQNVNPALRIVTACAVVSDLMNIVYLKVAKGATTLQKLSSGELTALQAYINQKGTAGVTYIVTSSDPDRLYISASIYYKGIYSAVIQANVIAAINTYLKTFSVNSFGGIFYLSDLQAMIKGIEGVNDVVFTRVNLRYSTQSALAGINLVSAGTEINRKYITNAGYIIQEDTTGYTFADTLTFIAE